MNRTAIFSMFIACMSFQAIAQSGSITNISVQQRTDGSGLLDVYFDLSGEFGNFNIFLEASFDNGLTYLPLDPAFLQGDTGPLPSGTQYHIVWDGYASFPDTFSEEAKLKIIAIKDFGCPGIPFFVDDRDSTIYNTVLIGDQCWMKENLNYSSDESWCFEDNEIWCNFYGSLYSWDEVMAGAPSSNAIPSGVQGICPAGWHVPSNAEWAALHTWLVDVEQYPVAIVGNSLKSCRQINSPLGGECDTDIHPRWDEADNPEEETREMNFGTDDFGFSALPAGARGYTGMWFELGRSAAWWTSTQSDDITAKRWMLDINQGSLTNHSPYKDNGFSVRCVKD